MELCLLLLIFVLRSSTTINGAADKRCEKMFSSGSGPVHFNFAVTLPAMPFPVTYTVQYLIESYIAINSIINVLVINGSGTFWHVNPLVSSTGNIAMGDFSFDLQNVSRSTAGTYELRNSTGSILCLTLYLLGRPSTPSLTSSSVPEAGDNMIFTCSSTSNTFPADHGLSFIFTWFIDSQANIASSRFLYSGKTLSISNVQKTDKNKYISCAAKENITEGLISETSKELRIDVYYGPDNVRLIPSNKSYILESGTYFQDVKCEADCNPKCDYRWYKNNSVLQSSETLVLGVLNTTDAATYFCKVNRSTHVSVMSFSINIIYPAKVIDFYATQAKAHTTIVLNEGDYLELLCVVDSFPSAVIYLNKSEVVIQNTTNAHEIAYRFGHVQCSDNGKYVCSARNIWYRIESSSFKGLNVFVRCHLLPTDGYKERLFATVSQPYTLNVFVYGYPAASRFSWYKKTTNGWLILDLNDALNILFNDFYSNLTIASVTTDDFGVYGVRADNGLIGSPLTKEFTLLPKDVQWSSFERCIAGKPEEPVFWRCQLTFHSITAVTIEWIPGHNGGFPQRFVIMYKRDIDDIWTYYDQFENETGTRQTMSVTLDDFLIGYIYEIRMYSTNLQGNSSASTSCLIAIPDKSSRKDSNDANIGPAAGGGVAGGFALGLIVSFVSFFLFQRFRSSKDKHKCIKAQQEKTQEVYYNPSKEQVKETHQHPTTSDKPEREHHEYQELKQRSDEQQYEQIKLNEN